MRKRGEALAGAARSDEDAAMAGTTAQPVVQNGAKPDSPITPMTAGPAGYDFASANPSKLKPVRQDMQRVIDTIWVTDVHAAEVKIRESLKIGEKRSEHAFLHKGVDDSSEVAFDAHRLYLTCKFIYEAWELENAVIFAAMWNAAEEALEEEIVNKLRKKPPTDTDVRYKCATMFPDQYAAQEKKRLAMKLTVEGMQALCKAAGDRPESLRSMLNKLRG